MAKSMAKLISEPMNGPLGDWLERLEGRAPDVLRPLLAAQPVAKIASAET